MKPRDSELANQLGAGLLLFEQNVHALPGIRDPISRDVLLEQVLESVHRVKYVSIIAGRDVSIERADPNSLLFDPLKGAIFQQRRGNRDEAFWLVFLFVHFGKNSKAGWRYAREVYGRLGDGSRWDWASVSADPISFRNWLDRHQGDLKRESVARGFGNHRKYVSLSAHSDNGTGAAVASYVEWVNPPRTHTQLMDKFIDEARGDPRIAFDALYRSMSIVTTFGRLARFDYLAMVGKLRLASIEPAFAYIKGNKGPLTGAQLLFEGSNSGSSGSKDFDSLLLKLDTYLGVGMQVIEDALCNWQKSPREFRPFRG